MNLPELEIKMSYCMYVFIYAIIYIFSINLQVSITNPQFPLAIAEVQCADGNRVFIFISRQQSKSEAYFQFFYVK